MLGVGVRVHLGAFPFSVLQEDQNTLCLEGAQRLTALPWPRASPALAHRPFLLGGDRGTC